MSKSPIEMPLDERKSDPIESGVGNVMKRIKIDNVQPGDILFTARPGKISSSIRIATHGIVSHAMICVQHSSFIDSTADGVQARNLQREFFENDEQIFHYRLKNPLSDAALSKIINYVRAQIGTRYSVPEAARSVKRARSPRTKKQYCSRLVAKAYKEAGIDLVADADYCSPEDVRISPLLIEIPAATETVSAEEVERWSRRRDPVKATHVALNAVLATARTIDPSVENLDDIAAMLRRRLDSDQVVAAALRDSGYLDLYNADPDEHPWRYDHAKIEELTDDDADELRTYCIATVREAYTGGLRYASNLRQVQEFYRQVPLESFRLQVVLFEKLVLQNQQRREVAYGWLSRHYPDDLKDHMQQIKPHSVQWYTMIEQVNPELVVGSRYVIARRGKSDICTICGDEPSVDYRLVNGAQTEPGVPSLRLCEDCAGIRRNTCYVIEPFLRD